MNNKAIAIRIAKRLFRENRELQAELDLVLGENAVLRERLQGANPDQEPDRGSR